MEVNDQLEKEVLNLIENDEVPDSVLDKAMLEMEENIRLNQLEKKNKLKRILRFAIPVLVPILLLAIILPIVFSYNDDTYLVDEGAFKYDSLIKEEVSSIKEDTDFLYLDAEYIEYAYKLYHESGSYVSIEEKGKFQDYIYKMLVIYIDYEIDIVDNYTILCRNRYNHNEINFFYSNSYDMIKFRYNNYDYYIYNHTQTYDSVVEICTNLAENQSK